MPADTGSGGAAATVTVTADTSSSAQCGSTATGAANAGEPDEDVTRQQLAKWGDFFDRGFAPWDAGAPASQLVALLDAREAQGKPPFAHVAEVGCGSGATIRWLAMRAMEVAVGIDIVPAAVEAARAAAAAAEAAYATAATDDAAADAAATDAAADSAAAGTSANGTADNHRATRRRAEVAFVEADVLNLPPPLTADPFDFVFDCQCFHCTYFVDRDAAVAALASLLKPGGTLLCLTGNADEPEVVGPAVLTRAELEGAFAGSGLFEVVSLERGRFDPTPAYRKLPRLPLCWVLEARRL